MSITRNLARVHRQLARLIPHADQFTVMVPGGSVEDEYGNVTPGMPVPSLPLTCKADRLTAEDASKAGLSGSAEVWQLVSNDLYPAVTPQDTVTVILEDGRMFSIAVRKVAGTHRQILTGEVV